MRPMLLKTALMLGPAMVCLGVPASALAQANAAQLQEIIVTARRVEERLQDVPISITVFNQAELDKRNVVTINDLVNYTPSLAVNERFGPEKAAFALRGFNQDDNTAPTVGVYFADVVGVRSGGSTTGGNVVGPGAFMDLENVQVLKGPQGTLFGRNTTGGAVLLVPKRPTDVFEGYIEGGVGNFDARRVQGVVNVPISETFKARASFDRHKRDGFMRNRSGIGPKHFNDVNYFAGRVSLLAELSPTLENYTVAHYSRSNTNGYGSHVFACDPALAGATGNLSLRSLLGAAACDQIARQNARGDSIYDIEYSEPNPFVKIKQWQIINTTTWRPTESLTVKNIFSYGEYRERTQIALFDANLFVPAGVTGVTAGPRVSPLTPGTPIPLITLRPTPGEFTGASRTITEELQLQGEAAGGRLKYVAGGYLEFSRPIHPGTSSATTFAACADTTNPAGCTSIPGFGSISDQWDDLEFDNHGVFAQATYDITEQLALTLGGRYTFDKIVGTDKTLRVPLPPVAGVLPTCRDTFRHPGVQTLDRDDCTTVLVEKSKEPTWLVNLDYKPTRDVLVYAKYARGYRQGGMSFTSPGLETWSPEKVDAYELGAKLSFSGSVRGFFNIAAFYNDYTNQQIFATPTVDRTNFPFVSGGTVIVNAGKSRIQGLEVDTSVSFIEGLTFSAAYTYLDTLLKSIDASRINLVGTPFIDLRARAVAGGPLNYTPKHKLTLSGTYVLPIPEDMGTLSIGATYSYTSNQSGDNSLTGVAADFGVLGTRNIINLNLDWRSVGGSDVDLAVFATNITKDKYKTTPGTGFQSFGFVDSQVGQPRMYGVRVRYNFGG